MGLLTTIFIAIGLAMDSFAVSLGVGTTRKANTPRPIFRVSFHLSLFQALFTFLGWVAGRSVVNLIENVDHWVVLILLLWVGGKMIYEGLNPEDGVEKKDLSRGKRLMAICVATSIDAVAVGLSLGVIHVDIWGACLAVFLVTLAFSLTGLFTGHILGERFGNRMEVLGGIILVFIGVRIFLEHTVLAGTSLSLLPMP